MTYSKPHFWWSKSNNNNNDNDNDNNNKNNNNNNNNKLNPYVKQAIIWDF